MTTRLQLGRQLRNGIVSPRAARARAGSPVAAPGCSRLTGRQTVSRASISPTSGGTCPTRAGFHTTTSCPKHPIHPRRTPYTGPSPSNPFSKAGPLLDRPDVHSLDTVLSAIHPIAFEPGFPWPHRALLRVLAHRSHQDASALLTLLPVVRAHVRREGVGVFKAGAVLRAYVERLSEWRALAAVPAVVEAWVGKVKGDARGKGMSSREFWGYRRCSTELIMALRHFNVRSGEAAAAAPAAQPAGKGQGGSAKGDGKGKGKEVKVELLSPVIQRQIQRLLEGVIEHGSRVGAGAEGDGQGESGRSALPLDGALRRVAFDPLVLTFELRTVLLQTIPRRALSVAEWHACMLSAAREGREDLAREFHAAKYERMAWVQGAGRGPKAESGASDGAERVDQDGDREGEEGDNVDMDDVGGASSEDAVDSLLRAGQELATASTHLASDGIVPTPPRAAPTRKSAAMLQIDALIRARSYASRDELLALLRSHLSHEASQGTAALSQYAWSALTTHCAAQIDDVSAKELLSLVRDIPTHAICAQVITPVIQGLVNRDHHRDAMDLWDELVAMRADRDTLTETPFLVDRVALAAATYACAGAKSLDDAVRLVDDWAERVRKPAHNDKPDRLSLDTQNLNVLLHACVLHRQPSLAFRLLAAARPRWGVWPDGISLGLVVDAARFAVRLDDTPSVTARLRAIAQEIGLGWKDPGQAADDFEGGDWEAERGRRLYDDMGFAAGPTSVLLDEPSGDERAGRDRKDVVRWHERARALFREVVLTNAPSLVDMRSPLDIRSPLPSLRHILATSPNNVNTNNTKLDSSDAADVPSPRARFPHVIPTASTFQSYVTLLGYFHYDKEVPTVLAWMRHLGVEPNWKTMCSALAFVCETEGPRRWVRHWDEVVVEPDEGDGAGLEADGNDDKRVGGHGQVDGDRDNVDDAMTTPTACVSPAKTTRRTRSRLVRDEEILRRWLQSWVKGEVPTEHDVAKFISGVKARGGRMSA